MFIQFIILTVSLVEINNTASLHKYTADIGYSWYVWCDANEKKTFGYCDRRFASLQISLVAYRLPLFYGTTSSTSSHCGNVFTSENISLVRKHFPTYKDILTRGVTKRNKRITQRRRIFPPKFSVPDSFHKVQKNFLLAIIIFFHINIYSNNSNKVR